MFVNNQHEGLFNSYTTHKRAHKEIHARRTHNRQGARAHARTQYMKPANNNCGTSLHARARAENKTCLPAEHTHTRSRTQKTSDYVKFTKESARRLRVTKTIITQNRGGLRTPEHGIVCLIITSRRREHARASVSKRRSTHYGRTHSNLRHL